MILLILLVLVILFIKWVFSVSEDVTHPPYYKDRSGAWRKWRNY